MSFFVLVVLVSTVFSFGVCHDSEAKKHLEAELKKTNDLILTTTKEVEELSKKTNEFIKECADKIKAGNDHVISGNTENKKLGKTLTEEWTKLKNLYDEEDSLNKVHIDFKKIQLGLKVLAKDKAMLENRRQSKMASECLSLQGMIENSGSRTVPMTDDRILDTIVVENGLRLATTRLLEVQLKKKDLEQAYKYEEEMCNFQKTALEKILERLNADKESVTKDIERVKSEIPKQQKIVDELKKTNESSKKNLENIIGESKEHLNNFMMYAAEATCYTKLVSDVEQLVSTPK